jgi:hypothetical protein
MTENLLLILDQNPETQLLDLRQLAEQRGF